MPSIQITAPGRQALLDARNAGLLVQLTQFKVGSGSNYVPDPNAAAPSLQGSVLFSGPISKFENAPSGALIVWCYLSPEVGPFDFGEIGIYTADGTLFAVGALPQVVTKYSSLNSAVPSAVRFSIYIDVGQDNEMLEVVDYATEYTDQVAADLQNQVTLLQSQVAALTAAINQDPPPSTSVYDPTITMTADGQPTGSVFNMALTTPGGWTNVVHWVIVATGLPPNAEVGMFFTFSGADSFVFNNGPTNGNADGSGNWTFTSSGWGALHTSGVTGVVVHNYSLVWVDNGTVKTKSCGKFVFNVLPYGSSGTLINSGSGNAGSGDAVFGG